MYIIITLAIATTYILVYAYTINYTDKSCFRTLLDFCVVIFLSALNFSIQAPVRENPLILTHSVTIESNK